MSVLTIFVFTNQVGYAKPGNKGSSNKPHLAGFQEKDYEVIQESKQGIGSIVDAGNESNKTEIHLITTKNLLIESNVSAEYINSKLVGTGLEGLGDAFKDAEKNYKINAIFLVGLAIHESNYGSSKIAKEKNNLFGFKAYDRSPFKSATSFKSKKDCINFVAKYISENYLNPNGKYFRGYGVSALGENYASDKRWASSINRRIIYFLEK